MPLTCHLLPPFPSMNSKPQTCTAHSCGINSTTKKRSRLIDQSSGEFFNFFIWPTIMLKIPLPYEPSPATRPDHELQSPLPRTFPPASILDLNKEAGPFTIQVVSYSFFIGPTILPKIRVPHLPSSTTPPGHELQAPLPSTFPPTASI